MEVLKPDSSLNSIATLHAPSYITVMLFAYAWMVHGAPCMVRRGAWRMAHGAWAHGRS